MNEYSSSAPKEFKSIALYRHDQYPFPKRSVTEDSYPQQRHSFQTSRDLQGVIIYYQSQPELLRLILQSKLEEDKRRAEEAKLRSKELDLMMLQQQQQQQQQQQEQQRIYSNSRIDSIHTPAAAAIPGSIAPITIDSNNTTSNNISITSNLILRRPSLAAIDQPVLRRASPSFTHHIATNAAAAAATTTTTTTTTTTAACSAITRMSSSSEEDLMPPTPHAIFQSPSFPLSSTKPTGMTDEASYTPIQPSTSNYHPLPPIQRYEPYFSQRPRRRREMQAITKIVETREYPYLDGHFWKNNGNTTQKKTGNKSVYYKCANSIKGCPVNKTVTWKENGEYLIKYRGEHFPGCTRRQQEQHQYEHQPM